MKISTRYSHLAVIGIALSSVIPAFAKETPQQIEGRKAIASNYAKVDLAFKRRDLKTISYYLAPDFKIYTPDGKVENRAQYIALQTQNFAKSPLQNMKLTTKIIKIQWRGNDAIVWVNELISFTQQGVPCQRKSVSRDYWAKTGKGWFIRQGVQLERHAYVAGREVNPG